jgi:hypothetical protein
MSLQRSAFSRGAGVGWPGNMARDPEVGQASTACRSARAEPGRLPKQNSGQASTACPTSGTHPRSDRESRTCEQFPESNQDSAKRGVLRWGETQ